MLWFSNTRQSKAVNDFLNGLTGGNPRPDTVVDAEVSSFIERLYRADRFPEPEAAFLDRLESRLTAQRDSEVEPVSAPGTLHPWRISSAETAGSHGGENRGRQFASRLPSLFSVGGRWMAAQAAVLFLFAVIAGGLAVVYFVQSDDPANDTSIPAAIPDEDRGNPEDMTHVETLVSAVIDPSLLALGQQSDWKQTFFENVTVPPGREFILCQYDYCDSGLALFSVLEGQLTIEATEPVLVFRADTGSAGSELIDPGTGITLGPGDSAAFSALSLSYARNDTSNRVDFLTHYTGVLPVLRPSSTLHSGIPTSYVLGTSATDTNLAPQFRGPISLSIERISLAAGAEVPVEIREGETLLAVAPDDIFRFDTSSVPVTDSAAVLHGFPPGTYQLRAMASESAEIYLARMSNAADQDAPET